MQPQNLHHLLPHARETFLLSGDDYADVACATLPGILNIERALLQCYDRESSSCTGRL
jgi:hypothetical protein